MTTDKPKLKNQQAAKVSMMGIAVNAALFALKLAAGIIGNSAAMTADSVNSAADVFSGLGITLSIKFAGKDSDEKHPYGHERIECIAAVILAVISFLTGVFLGIEAVKNIATSQYQNAELPGVIALIAAVISVITKEALYRYTKAVAQKTGSVALMAGAWDHRADSLSSFGGLIGIAASRAGLAFMDSAAAFIISLFIIKTSFLIAKDGFDKMIDSSCEEDVAEKMREVVMSQNGVMGIDLLKTRMFASKIYVDIEISADGTLTLSESHDIAERVHDAIEAEFEDVKHCMVHVNPVKL